MTHIIEDSKKLRLRVRRIQGQTAGLERSLSEGAECEAVLMQIAAIRGALDGLMSQVLHDHLLNHIAAEESALRRRRQANDVSKILKSYLR